MTNRNPLKQIEITVPHSRRSIAHPHHQLMKQDLADFLEQAFSIEGLVIAEEPHAEARPALHLHVIMLLKKKESLTRVRKIVNEQYDYMFGNTIEYRALRNVYSFYRYITEPNYQTSDANKPPKSPDDVDPDPLVRGRRPTGPTGRRRINQSDWNRVCNSLFRYSNCRVQRDFAIVLRHLEETRDTPEKFSIIDMT